MTHMVKLGQIVGASERPTAFTSSNIKWVVPVDAPTIEPLPPVFPLSEVTFMDGKLIKVTDSVDSIMTAVNAP